MFSLKTVTTIFLTLFALHFLAVFRNWYWSIPWLDVPMHWLGGFMVAVFFLWLITTLPFLFKQKHWFIDILFILSFTALIGVLWEFFEFSFDVFANITNLDVAKSQVSLADTMADLFFDLLGGFCAYLLYLFTPSSSR